MKTELGNKIAKIIKNCDTAEKRNENGVIYYVGHNGNEGLLLLDFFLKNKINLTELLLDSRFFKAVPNKEKEIVQYDLLIK